MLTLVDMVRWFNRATCKSRRRKATTRLLAVMVEGELAGRLTRQPHPDGLTIEICFPLTGPAVAHQAR